MSDYRNGSCNHCGYEPTSGYISEFKCNSCGCLYCQVCGDDGCPDCGSESYMIYKYIQN
jgi:hypothetical protein